MSLSATLNNVFSLEGPRARYGRERVTAQEEPNTDSENGNNNSSNGNSGSDSEDVESGAASANSQNNQDSSEGAAAASATTRRNSSSSIEQSQRRNNETSEEETTGDDSQSLVADPEGGDSDDGPRFTSHSQFVRGNTMTLAELEEQRELSRRRSSACVLLAVFVLFRLWIECLKKQDPTLLLLCLLGTSWTARWIRYNRDREEELDRRIESYLQNNNNTTEVDRNDFARLSFQAQLALAIMESQRHMMEGGYGRPDEEDQTPGVSDEAKTQWKKFQWKGAAGKKGDYGAVPSKLGADLDNHCSICLSEYEESDTLTQLPCGHVYHDECIQSWTQNHLKCPLCNADLESVTENNDSVV